MAASTAKKAAKSKAAKTAKPSADAASNAVDEQLARYRSMRDFKITAEPSGAGESRAKTKSTAQLPFCVQKHAASHLHYDFRLGWNGVLKSWAVAKGPSYVVADKRLAVQVEDHPMEYGGFEGVIPKGQYGGGTVMLWDQGTWEPQPAYPDVDAGLRSGSLKFILHGTKLKGKWALIRMHGKSGGPEAKPNWLLIKEHDGFERSASDPAVADAEPNSVVTGRDIDQIARSEDHVWNSKDTRSGSQAWYRQESKATPRLNLSKQLAKLPRESQPAFLSPQLAQQAESPPASSGWLHELKLDGYRIQARKSSASGGSEAKIQLLTRKGLDWTHRMPAIAAAVARLPAHDCTLDGEVVVLGPDGNSSFADLQASFQNTEAHRLTYFVFDLLHLNGHNTRNLGLRDRKQLLAELLPPSDEALRLSEDIAGDGEAIFHHACKLHAEGIISKRADAPYRSIRSSDWLKSKCLREQELVIAGYTLSTAGPDRIGSLLLGYYETAKSGKYDSAKPGKHRCDKLIYAGRTGTGFTQQLKRDLLTRLARLKTPEPAFDQISTADRRGALWVKPQLVAQVRFATWTADNLVRQAAFLGLREDKSPTEVTREEPTVAPKPKQGGSRGLQPPE